MGEYAWYGRERVKIGTCEDLLYLRADQRHLVAKRDFSDSDPSAHLDVYRFRFPFPDEDSIPPGGFEDYSRGYRVKVGPPAEVEHDDVNRSDDRDDLVPCGKCVEIVQQRYKDGVWMLVCRCTRCRLVWRYETWEDVMPIVNELSATAREYARMNSPAAAAMAMGIAQRILWGYDKGRPGNEPGNPWATRAKPETPALRLVAAPEPTPAPKPAPVVVPTDPRAIVMHVVKDRDSKRGGTVYPGGILHNTTVEIVLGESVVIRTLVPAGRRTHKVDGKYVPTTEDETVVKVFKIGDVAEVGSFNLVYTGNVRKITEKTITVVEYEDNPGMARTYRMSIYDFARRNWDFDLEVVCERNANWRD